jgi:hypothetical protein
MEAVQGVVGLHLKLHSAPLAEHRAELDHQVKFSQALALLRQWRGAEPQRRTGRDPKTDRRSRAGACFNPGERAVGITEHYGESRLQNELQQERESGAATRGGMSRTRSVAWAASGDRVARGRPGDGVGSD